MPKKDEILNGLQSIANNFSFYAIVWHIIFYGIIIALVSKWSPSKRISALFLCLPLFSVAVFAWITGNPFNGILFLVLSLLVLLFGFKANINPVSFSKTPYLVAGVLMIVFGLVYPHFIETNSIIKYLYASPVGLIPCPTLSILIGFLLIFNGFESNPLMLILLIAGLFYGLFGTFKLAVYIDIFLILGTFSLLVKYIMVLRNH